MVKVMDGVDTCSCQLHQCHHWLGKTEPAATVAAAGMVDASVAAAVVVVADATAVVAVIAAVGVAERLAAAAVASEELAGGGSNYSH